MKRKSNRGKKVFLVTVSVMILWLFVAYLFITYKNIDVQTNYDTQKLQSTDMVQTVEKVEEKSNPIADTVENVTQSVVGISKLISIFVLSLVNNERQY